MSLGTITGKTTTTEFKFKVVKEAKKYQYIKIPFNDSFVFAQIIELETNNEETLAQCLILGSKEEEKLRPLRIPLTPGTEVEEADDDFINQALGLENEKGAFLGTLDYTNLKVYIDLNKLLTKHIAILARSGSGKSYCASVIIEEILDRNIPLVIIDPHAEYSSLKFSNKKEEEKLKKFDLKPKAYLKNIQEYTPDVSINSEAQKLKLSLSNLSPSTLLHLLPAKLSNMQVGLLYSSLQNLDKINFDDLIISLDTEETNVKYTLINLVEQIKKLNIFSEVPTPLQELVQPGRASIINLKGISPEISEIVVYKLVNDLFEARKLGNIPPFFLVIEEAQNFAPERSFGEAKSSQIIRRVLAEGRKFGLGVALISQRPSRLDKSALSQCTTQIILKVTNPSDLKSITSSVEGLTSEVDREIKNLPIGTALLIGVVSQPLFVNVRPRKSKHGGEAIDIVGEKTEESEEETPDLLSVIKQSTSLKDLELMSKRKIKSKETFLIPCLFLQLQKDSSSYNILVSLYENKIIKNPDTMESIPIENFKFSESQLKIVKLAIGMKSFTPAELFNLSKMQFSEVYDVIRNLTQKGFFIKNNNSFVLNKQFSYLSEIDKLNIYKKPEYLKVKYDKILETKYKKENILDLFSKFFNIVNSKECYLEYFRVNYEEAKEISENT